MSIKRVIQLASIGAVLALGSTTVYAKDHATNKQTHHCKLADGTTDATKTHKQCTAAKGAWAKDAAGSTTTAPSATKPTTDTSAAADKS